LTKKPYVTIILQAINVVINAVVFLLTYRYLGFYSIFLAYAVAILFSFSISLFFQYRILNSLIFDSLTQLLKIIFIFIICCLTGYVGTLFIYDNLLKLIIIPVFIFLGSYSLLWYLKLLKKEDIQRYLQENTGLYNLSLKLLVRN
ncbi:MAG: hypothetical protein NTU73_05810, partial [Ignavibacteriae bacterium]|nr:hypothetical protein [Ignavibacteriota bacterium]